MTRSLKLKFHASVNFARIVPDGLLIFFPSYYLLDQCISCWKTTVRHITLRNKWSAVYIFFITVFHAFQGNGNLINSSTVWERICKFKFPVVEPRQSSLFPLAIEVSSANTDVFCHFYYLIMSSANSQLFHCFIIYILAFFHGSGLHDKIKSQINFRGSIFCSVPWQGMSYVTQKVSCCFTAIWF